MCLDFHTLNPHDCLQLKLLLCSNCKTGGSSLLSIPSDQQQICSVALICVLFRYTCYCVCLSCSLNCESTWCFWLSVKPSTVSFVRQVSHTLIVSRLFIVSSHKKMQMKQVFKDTVFICWLSWEKWLKTENWGDKRKCLLHAFSSCIRNSNQVEGSLSFRRLPSSSSLSSKFTRLSTKFHVSRQNLSLFVRKDRLSVRLKECLWVYLYSDAGGQVLLSLSSQLDSLVSSLGLQLGWTSHDMRQDLETVFFFMMPLKTIKSLSLNALLQRVESRVRLFGRFIVSWICVVLFFSSSFSS
jgi:hypothetical protein